MIRETHSLTNRPFGVNLVLQWDQEERLCVCLEEGVAVVSFFWGDPSPYIASVHAAGAFVMHTIASATEAKQARDMGVDVWSLKDGRLVDMSGVRSGPFHSCHALWMRAVAPLPVLAASGIADGRGIAAALVLGAAGVWLGTRFLASAEAHIHPLYREKILHASETDTVYSCLFDDGWPNAPHRALRNSTIMQWEASGSPHTGERPGEGETIAARVDGKLIARYSDVLPQPGMEGNAEALALYVGQGVGLISDIQPAGDVLKRLVDETIQALTHHELLLS